MDRVKALESLGELGRLKTKVITHNPNTRIHVEPDVITFRPGGGGHSMELTTQGAEGLEAFAGMPKSYGKVLKPQTFGTLATELLEVKNQYTIIMEDGKINGFAKAGDMPYVDPERVFKAIERVIPEVSYDRVMPLDRNFAVMVDAVAASRTEICVGDPASAGATMVFSPIGIQIPSVVSYIKRWFCLNGASSFNQISEFKFTGGGDSGGAFYPWLNQSIKRAYHAFNDILNEWRVLITQDISPADRAGILDALLKKSGLNSDAADSVRAHALEEPPSNAFELMNLITWGSSHIETDPIRVLRARRAAHDFSHERTHDRSCPFCHRNTAVAQLPAPSSTSAG
jgi:hypothetical protein